MAGILESVVTDVAESSADKAMQELKYLCCYKSYVDDFEDQKKHLKARRETIQKDIKEALGRNENQIESEVELWLRDADALINEDIKGKKKWFGLVPNCFWQYNRGRDLEGKKQMIQELVEQSHNFTRVARSTGLPGIEFYSNENFRQLKDRELKFGELTEALKNDKKFVIGLYGLGGTGKTTMAIEVGKEVAESMVFDKVIFSVVSKDPNLRSIRDNIAKQLKLTLEETWNESQQAQELWKRIAEGGEKVLIILDDVWEQLTLKDIGIPLGHHLKGCCSILLTTRDLKVCRDMGCHEAINLEVLNEKDAVDLFLFYAGPSIDGCSNDFKDVALDIVKECGRLPVAIVAVARAMNSWPQREWKDGLERLRNLKAIHDVKEDLEGAYKSLRLSYEYLKSEEAKKLFLLCSLFPYDYEIPIELLIRIAKCLRLCGESNEYSTTRIHFTPIKNVLMGSSLLLNAENEAVKMHDLVREVALWIGNKLVQVVMGSSKMVMENIQYSSWNINDFPSHFNGKKLEVLLLWISNNSDSTTVKVPDGIFEGMDNLKFLGLMNWSNIRISGASLFQSHPSLINARTLAIKGFELGDISILANLKSLESLELSKCLMIELPKEITELKKLRLLEMTQCDIERNNPFEVIESCSQLEELYFDSNQMLGDTCESLPQITTFPKLQRYQIKARRVFIYYKVDFSISRYFDSRFLGVNFSDEIFKSLVARVEVLKLGGDYYNKGWTNVVPDILPVKDDSMEDQLTRLCLQSMNGIKCLIHNECGVAIFSKLVKLKLSKIDIRELCCGTYPVNFLKQLEKLHLSWCKHLEGSLFGKLELCNLKSIRLCECSMICLFHPITAQSLKQLEMLHIEECSGLKYIVAKPREDHDPNQKSHDSMFPKLKYLEVRFCTELKFILPICFCTDLPLLESMEISDCEKLEYIFGQYPDEKDLKQMEKEDILQSLEKLNISGVPNFINLYAKCSVRLQKSSPSTNQEDCTRSLSRGRLCCFGPKSNASTIYRPSASTNHNGAMNVNYVVNRVHQLFTPPLYPYTLLRRVEITKLVGLKSLFTLSIVSSLKLLEILKVEACNALEHIVTDKEDDHDHMNVDSASPNFVAPQQAFFPELRTIEVRDCKRMEYLFSISSGKLPRLLSVNIQDTPQLGEVFRWKHGEGQKPFPKLYMIRLVNLPALHTICQGIDFHTVKLRRVRECPAISLTSANDSSEELKKLRESFERNSVHEDEDASYVTMISTEWAFESEEVPKEITEEDSTTKSNLPNFIENLKATFGEDSSKLCGKESMNDYQQAHGESRSSNEAPQRIEEPTKETSNEASLKIPPPSIIEMTSTPAEMEAKMELLKANRGGYTEHKQNRISPNLSESEEVLKEIAAEDSTTNSNLPNFTKSTKTSANEIVEEKLSTTPSSDLDMNLKTIFGEGPSSEKYGKASSSKDLSIFTLKKPPTAISTTHTETKSSQSDMFVISINTECPQVEIMTNDETCTDEEEMKFDQRSSSQIFEEHDLMRLFQMMKEGADMEVDLSYVSKLIADLHDNKEVTKALADLEASLKKGLNEIACSEESRLLLQNALNILSSHCSEDGSSSLGLQDTIRSLQQEIQIVLSSFNQAYATIDTFTKLEQKEKLMIEQCSEREKDAKTLLYDINTTKNSIAEVQLNEAKLKEQMSKLQAELCSKEEEIEEYERKLLSLQEQEKKSVFDTIGFTMEFLAMLKERSRKVEDQMKAKQQLENMGAKWSSCLSNLKKTMMLLGVYFKQKL